MLLLREQYTLTFTRKGVGFYEVQREKRHTPRQLK